MAPEIRIAQARAAEARAAFQSTLKDAQIRLRPANLAGEAVDRVKHRSEVIAGDAVTAVRKRPVVAASAAAGVGALLGTSLLLWRRTHRHGDSQ